MPITEMNETMGAIKNSKEIAAKNTSMRIKKRKVLKKINQVNL